MTLTDGASLGAASLTHDRSLNSSGTDSFGVTPGQSSAELQEINFHPGAEAVFPDIPGGVEDAGIHPDLQSHVLAITQLRDGASLFRRHQV